VLLPLLLLLLLLLLLVGSAVHVRTTVYFLFKVPVRLYCVVARKEIGGRSNRATIKVDTTKLHTRNTPPLIRPYYFTEQKGATGVPRVARCPGNHVQNK
jgi:hypothetical protein